MLESLFDAHVCVCVCVYVCANSLLAITCLRVRLMISFACDLFVLALAAYHIRVYLEDILSCTIIFHVSVRVVCMLVLMSV
jgi:hypothetical protein